MIQAGIDIFMRATAAWNPVYCTYIVQPPPLFLDHVVLPLWQGHA